MMVGSAIRPHINVHYMRRNIYSNRLIQRWTSCIIPRYIDSIHSSRSSCNHRSDNTNSNRCDSATAIRGSVRRDCECIGSVRSLSSSESSSGSEYIKLADPAPGSPFHLALPVHDLDIAKDFYGNIIGCAEGRSSEKWQDYSLNGHQIVCHWVGNDYRCQDYFNPVDGDEVPVPHFGLALTEPQFHTLAQRLKNTPSIKFIIEPHLRFKGQPGEQWTMFFKDPSGNNLEFKAMTRIENLFAKYGVVD